MKQNIFSHNEAYSLDLIIKYRENTFSFNLIDSHEENEEETSDEFNEISKVEDTPPSPQTEKPLLSDSDINKQNEQNAISEFKPFTSLCFLLSGELQLGTKGQPKQLLKSGYSYIDFDKKLGGTLNTSDDNNLQTFNIHFSKAAFQNYYKQLQNAGIIKFPIHHYAFSNTSKKLIAFQTNAALLIILHQLHECPYIGNSRISYLQSKIFELLIVYFDNVNKHLEGEDNDSTKLIDSDIQKIKFLKQKLSYIQEERLQINDLAKEIGMSSTDMQVKFKLHTGKTIIQYHREHILESSLNLLKSGMPIKNIAYACGYSSTSAFSKAFSKYFGFSPSKIQHDN